MVGSLQQYTPGDPFTGLIAHAMVMAQAPAAFLGGSSEDEDDFDALAGAAEASLMADGSFVAAASLEQHLRYSCLAVWRHLCVMFTSPLPAALEYALLQVEGNVGVCSRIHAALLSW